MKLAIKILSYILGVIMFFGAVSYVSEGALDLSLLIAFLIVEAQVVLTLIYIHDK